MKGVEEYDGRDTLWGYVKGTNWGTEGERLRRMKRGEKGD